MAKKDTVHALVRRGVKSKIAETVADAGFTIGSLRAAPLDELLKILTQEDAENLLDKVGTKKKTIKEAKDAIKKKSKARSKTEKSKVKKNLPAAGLWARN